MIVSVAAPSKNSLLGRWCRLFIKQSFSSIQPKDPIQRDPHSLDLVALIANVDTGGPAVENSPASDCAFGWSRSQSAECSNRDRQPSQRKHVLSVCPTPCRRTCTPRPRQG